MSEIDWKARAEAAEAREAVLLDLIRRMPQTLVAQPGKVSSEMTLTLADLGLAAAARDARIREEGRREGIEEAAGVATSPKHVAPVCPYANDQPGDPTWTHTDKDVCPVCKKTGENSAGHCTVYVGGRISTAIRALLDPEAVLKMMEDGR